MTVQEEIKNAIETFLSTLLVFGLLLYWNISLPSAIISSALVGWGIHKLQHFVEIKKSVRQDVQRVRAESQDPLKLH